ncbi:MAG: hypothetical protein BBJ57_12360 [Desulfobacterales bacterium PC51MH44]|nr:MAG: hypothetical protein BBJ57_12360 [Desulfobacterales bacterium PC51MH44]
MSHQNPLCLNAAWPQAVPSLACIKYNGFYAPARDGMNAKPSDIARKKYDNHLPLPLEGQ